MTGVTPCADGRAVRQRQVRSSGARGEILAMGHNDARMRSSDALINLMFYTLLALFVAVVPVALLAEAIGDKRVFRVLYPVAVAGSGIWAWLATRFKAQSLWESTTWLDFDKRSWHHEIRYTDASAPTNASTLGWDALALMCYDELCGEDADQYRLYSVSLCRRRDAEQIGLTRRPEDVNLLLVVESKEDSLAFAFDTARQWELPCWRHDWPGAGSADSRSMTRLC